MMNINCWSLGFRGISRDFRGISRDLNEPEECTVDVIPTLLFPSNIHQSGTSMRLFLIISWTDGLP